MGQMLMKTSSSKFDRRFSGHLETKLDIRGWTGKETKRVSLLRPPPSPPNKEEEENSNFATDSFNNKINCEGLQKYY